jgi:hypothetical protein
MKIRVFLVLYIAIGNPRIKKKKKKDEINRKKSLPLDLSILKIRRKSLTKKNFYVMALAFSFLVAVAY